MTEEEKQIAREKLKQSRDARIGALTDPVVARELGVNLETGEEAKGTFELIKDRVTGNFTETDTSGVNAFGANSLEVFGKPFEILQNVVYSANTQGVNEDIIKSRETLGNYYNQINLLNNKVNSTNNPDKKQELSAQLDSLRQEADKYKIQVDSFEEKYAPNVKEILLDGVQGLSVIASAGVGSAAVGGTTGLFRAAGTESALAGIYELAYQESKGEEINLASAGIAAGLGFALPLAGPAVAPIARSIGRLLPTKKNALNQSVDTLTKQAQLLSDDVLIEGQIPDKISVLIKDSIEKINLDKDLQADFLESINNTFRSLNSRADLEDFVTALNQGLKTGDVSLINTTIATIKNSQVSRAANKELNVIAQQKNEVIQQIKNISSDLPDASRSDLVEIITNIEKIPRSQRSKNSSAILVSKKKELAKYDILSKKDLDIIEKLQLKLSGLNKLENQIKSSGFGSGARVHGGKVSAQDKGTLNDLSNQFRLSDYFDKNGKIVKEVISPGRRYDKLTATQIPKSVQQRKAWNRNIIETLKLRDVARITKLNKVGGFFKEAKDSVSLRLSDDVNEMVQIQKLNDLIVDSATDFIMKQRSALGKVRHRVSLDTERRMDQLKILERIAKNNGVKLKDIKADLDTVLTSNRSLDVNNYKGLDADGNHFYLTDEVALANLERISKKYAADSIAWNKIIKDIYAHNVDKLWEAADAGLLDPEQVKILIKNSPHYVPMIRDIDDIELDGLIKVGQADDTIDPLVGMSEADILSPFEQSYKKLARLHRSVEEHKVQTSLALNIIKAQSEGVEEIQKIFKVRPTDRKKLAPNENGILVKDGDKSILITVNAPYRSEILDPFKNIYKSDDWLLRTVSILRPINSFIKAQLTGLNIGFKISAAFRDPAEAIMEATRLGMSTVGAHKAAFSHFKYADAIRNYHNGIIDEQSEIVKKAYEQGLSFMSYSNQGTKLLTKMRSNRPWLDAQLRGFEVFNEVTESTARMSFFKQALDEGFAADQAADIARKAMLDFDMKGQWKNYIEPLFIFFNATMLGNRNFYKAMTHTPTAIKTVGATSAAAGFQDTYNTAVGGPEWRSHFTEHELSSSFILVTAREDNPDGSAKSLDGLKYPLPISVRGLWSIENGAIQVARGKKPAGKAFLDSLVEQINLFSPTGNRAASADQDDITLGGFLMPTALQPARRVWLNTDFFNNDIVDEYTDSETGELIRADLPESFGDDWDEKAGLVLSDFIRKFTDDEDRLSDPRSIAEFLSGYVYMGMTKDVDKGIQLLNKIGTDEQEEINPSKIPILNRFMSSTREDMQHVRDKDNLIADAEMAESPEELQQLGFAHMLNSTNDAYLGRYPSTILEEAGVDGLPVTKTYGFYNDLDSSEWAAYKIDILNDESHPLHEKAKLRLAVLKRQKPEDYKRFVEYQAAADGLVNGTSEDIKQYFSERGVELKSVPWKSLNIKFYGLKRKVDKDAEIVYNEQEKLITRLSRKDDIQIDEMLKVVDNSRELVDKGFNHQDFQKEKEEKIYALYITKETERLVRLYSAGDITAEEMVNEARKSNIPGLQKAIIDYAAERALIRL